MNYSHLSVLASLVIPWNAYIYIPNKYWVCHIYVPLSLLYLSHLSIIISSAACNPDGCRLFHSSLYVGCDWMKRMKYVCDVANLPLAEVTSVKNMTVGSLWLHDWSKGHSGAVMLINCGASFTERSWRLKSLHITEGTNINGIDTRWQCASRWMHADSVAEFMVNQDLWAPGSLHS